MKVIADTGPIIHLHWVDALSWALPPQIVLVVDAIWEEITFLAPDALRDPRFQRVSGVAISNTFPASLDSAEAQGISLAISSAPADDIVFLSDDMRAREVCAEAGIPYIGSVGLIVEATRGGRVSRDIAIRAMEELPTRGKLWITDQILKAAIEELRTIGPLDEG